MSSEERSGRVSVRPGRPQDADAAFEVWRLAITERRSSAPSDEAAKRVRHRLAGADGLFLVALDGADVVGMAWGTAARSDRGAGAPIAGRFHLSLVFILPQRWGEGIGRMLTDEILDEARRRGFSSAELWTHEDNSRAQRLYRSRGFTPTSDVEPDGEGSPMRLWERAI